MLTELSLRNYRGHTATRIPLEPLTVLIGPNAVGKTSALEALTLLGRLLDGSSERVLSGKRNPEWLVRCGATDDLEVRVAGEADGSRWSMWVQIKREGTRQGVRPAWEDILPADQDELLRSVEQALKINRSQPPRPADSERLRGAVTLRLDARRLAEPSTSAEEIPSLEEDGYGLATVLSTLKLSSTSRFQKLEEAARRTVPSLLHIGFKRTRVERDGARPVRVEGQTVFVNETRTEMADALTLDFTAASGLPAHAASEGTLIVLGILAALYAGPDPEAPRLLLLEDIERALHPKAQQGLIAALRSVLASSPKTQIVATSHSPYLVDALTPNEVVVLGREAGGQVAARRLADHPKAKLLGVLTSGELWTAEGEDWVGET